MSPYIRVQLAGDDRWTYVDLRNIVEVRQDPNNAAHSIITLLNGEIVYTIDSTDTVTFKRGNKLWKS